MRARAELWHYKPRLADGRVPIRIRVNVGSKWKHVPGKSWFIRREDWNEETQRVRLRDEANRRVTGDRGLRAEDINASINACIEAVEAFARKYPDATIEQLISAPARAIAEREREADAAAPSYQLTFFEWADQFIERAQQGRIMVRTGKNKGRPISPDTVDVYRSSLNNLRAFHRSVRPIEWDTISRDLHEELIHWLRTSKNRRDNTVGKDLKILKALIGWAMLDLESERYAGKFPEVTAHTKPWFIVPREDVDKIALEPEETQAIINLDLTDRPGLIPHRDRFTVAYYFLQRFGDSLAVDRSNFYVKEGRTFVRYVSQKTGTETVVPVPGRVLEILNRYDFELPDMSNQKANEALKELGRLAAQSCESLNNWFYDEATVGGRREKTRYRRWEMITTHTCRRSGATDMDEAGVPIGVILALGGWSTESQLRTYIKRRARKMAEIAAQHSFFQ